MAHLGMAQWSSSMILASGSFPLTYVSKVWVVPGSIPGWALILAPQSTVISICIRCTLRGTCCRWDLIEFLKIWLGFSVSLAKKEGKLFKQGVTKWLTYCTFTTVFIRTHRTFLKSIPHVPVPLILGPCIRLYIFIVAAPQYGSLRLSTSIQSRNCCSQSSFLERY